ncbi:MAG: sigma-54 dependent transcriptional regulator [Desulfobacteraceae bacterium]|nr:sigma-54 dependent transcriptional regulator [Desulfobacteraceae bacterium]
MAKVLIIEDDFDVAAALSDMVTRLGHESTSCPTIEEGIGKTGSADWDLVFLDVRLPDGNGLDSIDDFKASASAPEVIVMTGYGDPDGAEVAIRSGAWDYLHKPLSFSNVRLSLKRVLQYRENTLKLQKQEKQLKLEGIVGSSRQLAACIELVGQAAQCEADVLITGETGTGKELFARAIHFNSARARNRLVVVDCAALPDTLVESALFGYERGAFTGADRAKEGLIKQADRGTLFLDEVGELSMSMQKAFLRVLQERSFRPLGGSREIASDFRLIAATNRDLDAMSRNGLFRDDLLFRLRSIAIHLPPLRMRPGDIVELVSHLTEQLFESFGITPKELSPEFMESVLSYTWPGNVRELMNALRTAISAATREPVVFVRHLPVNIRASLARSRAKAQPEDTPVFPEMSPGVTVSPFKQSRETILSEWEKKYFEALISSTKGNIREACRVSGLGRTQLYEMLKKHRISRLGWPD